jgi:hypothetical protein
VHNRLLTLLLFDVGSFAGLAPLLTNAVTTARNEGPLEVPHFGATYHESDEHEPAAGE